MNTSESAIDIVTPGALGLDKIPPNTRSSPKHVEVKSTEIKSDSSTSLAAPIKGDANVNYLQLLVGTTLNDGRIRKSMVETERLRIYHSDVLAYTRISRTLCLEAEFACVCRGAMTLDLAGENHVLYEGDSYFIPPNVPHILTAIYNSQVITVFSK
jgi:hypothetical protein